MGHSGTISATEDEDEDEDEVGDDEDDEDEDERGDSREEHVGRGETSFDVDPDPDAEDNDPTPKKSKSGRNTTAVPATERQLPPWKRQRPKQQPQQQNSIEKQGTWTTEDVNVDADRTYKAEHWVINRSPPPQRVDPPVQHDVRNQVVVGVGRQGLAGFGGVVTRNDQVYDNEKHGDDRWLERGTSAGSNEGQTRQERSVRQDWEQQHEADKNDAGSMRLHSNSREPRRTPHNSNHVSTINQHKGVDSHQEEMDNHEEGDEVEDNTGEKEHDGDEEATSSSFSSAAGGPSPFLYSLFPGLRKQRERRMREKQKKKRMGDGAEEEGRDDRERDGSEDGTDDVDSEASAEERQSESKIDASDELTALRRKIKDLEDELAAYKRKDEENAKVASKILKEKQAFENYCKQETEKINAMREEEYKKIRKERSLWEKQRRANAILPNKRERQEIELLKKQLADAQEASRQQNQRLAMANQRLQKRNEDLNGRIGELQGQVVVLERERCGLVEANETLQHTLTQLKKSFSSSPPRSSHSNAAISTIAPKLPTTLAMASIPKHTMPTRTSPRAPPTNAGKVVRKSVSDPNLAQELASSQPTKSGIPTSHPPTKGGSKQAPPVPSSSSLLPPQSTRFREPSSSPPSGLPPGPPQPYPRSRSPTAKREAQQQRFNQQRVRHHRSYGENQAFDVEEEEDSRSPGHIIANGGANIIRSGTQSSIPGPLSKTTEEEDEQEGWEEEELGRRQQPRQMEVRRQQKQGRGGQGFGGEMIQDRIGTEGGGEDAEFDLSQGRADLDKLAADLGLTGQRFKELRHEHKLDRQYNDGSVLSWYNSGILKRKWPDKSMRIWYKNGDMKHVSANQAIIAFYYAANKVIRELHPDGVECCIFPNDQIEKHYLDGSCEITYPDGTKKYRFANGHEESIFPDGTVQSVDEEGNKVLKYANGCKEYFHKGYKKKVFPNGSHRILYDDGTHELHNLDGSVRIRDKFVSFPDVMVV
ncbi:hypothetical protein HK102_002942 [Quaeritorhiza haematococci]|nr:hypothetical protein HK102_002942 [Quaeritorhiza haematococci]